MSITYLYKLCTTEKSKVPSVWDPWSINLSMTSSSLILKYCKNILIKKINKYTQEKINKWEWKPSHHLLKRNLIRVSTKVVRVVYEVMLEVGFFQYVLTHSFSMNVSCLLTCSSAQCTHFVLYLINGGLKIMNCYNYTFTE